eukprot:5016853-Alexandrium_andersonii.AAC.1
MGAALGDHPEMSASKRTATPPRLVGAVELGGIPALPALGDRPRSSNEAAPAPSRSELDLAIADLDRGTAAALPSA